MINIFEDVKDFVYEWKQRIKKEIKELEVPVKVAIIQVGKNEASERYVRNKVKDCQEVGISTCNFYYPEEDLDFETFKKELKIICQEDWGIIIQFPLPPQLEEHISEIKEIIPANKDIDGLKGDQSFFKPCTPHGIITYLTYKDFSFTGKNVLIIGRSNIVGKPLAKLLTDLNATVTLAHSKTENLWDFIPKSDLIISAVGQADFLDCKDIYWCPVVDVGINFKDGKLVGDCFNTEYRNVSPVPGGVGLLTRAAALQNILDCRKGEIEYGTNN